MAAKRAAESDPLSEQQPEVKKRATARDKFKLVVTANIRKHDLKCCMGPSGSVEICWDMWADNYFETLEQRSARGAPLVNEPLITLCETFASKLMDDYIGNFELQLVLHSLIYDSLHCMSKSVVTERIEALKEIRDKCPKGKKDEELWFKIMNEVINRYTFKYSPLIEDCLTYLSGKPIGVFPSDW